MTTCGPSSPALPTAESDAAVQVLAHLAAERGRAQRSVAEALASPRYSRLRKGLTKALGRRPHRAGDDVSLVDAARRRFKKLRKAVAALPAKPTDEQLHAVRIRVKRARYAAELVEAAAGRPARRFAKEGRAAARHPRRAPGCGRRRGPSPGAGRLAGRRPGPLSAAPADRPPAPAPPGGPRGVSGSVAEAGATGPQGLGLTSGSAEGDAVGLGGLEAAGAASASSTRHAPRVASSQYVWQRKVPQNFASSVVRAMFTGRREVGREALDQVLGDDAAHPDREPQRDRRERDAQHEQQRVIGEAVGQVPAEEADDRDRRPRRSATR